jgi:hypothetical protein
MQASPASVTPRAGKREVQQQRVTIASIQPPCPDETYTSPFGNVAAQELVLERGFALLEEALQLNTAFCCLPEYFNVFGADPTEYCALAAGNHESVLTRTTSLAQQHKSYIILPMLVPNGGGKFFNRAHLIGPDGACRRPHPSLNSTCCMYC